MNAETRANKVADDILDYLLVDGENVSASVLNPARDIIATAIRQAQNDKLEEAADAATKFLVGDPFNGVPLRSPGPHEIAAHIRSLKSKD